jgi:hypothetical protein
MGETNVAFDQATRNRLQKFVSDARQLLSKEFTQQLQNTYGLDPVKGSMAALDDLTDLSPSEHQTAKLLRDTFDHYLAANEKADPYTDKTIVLAALDRIVREQAFTVLNRLVALRMAEARQFLRVSISQGYQSEGFQLYQRIAGSALGGTGKAYQVYLFSVFDELSLDLAVLFDRYSSQGRLFPCETILLKLLDLINHSELEVLWAEDETIGWIYQYFNSVEERKKMRDESKAPRNSRELAVRNQFFTPRYVVEFLTDNTLGRIWYEMTKGQTTLVDSCKYLVRRPNEVFLEADQQAHDVEKNNAEIEYGLSQEDLLQQTVYFQHRPFKDPRDIKMLDPACGSMHFGLYAFDLFEKIYSEAWDLETSGIVGGGVRQTLHKSYDSKEAFLADVPRLIIEHNIHGVDIDPRAVQIAGLSLWLRAQKSWANNTIQPNNRPQILRSNIVCAEPMPGEKALLKEFTNQIQPRVLGQLVEEIFDKMQLAGEAGTLLKIEEEIQTAIEDAKAQMDEGGHWVQGSLFGEDKKEVPKGTRYNFDGGVSDDFWDQAEYLILAELERYAESAAGEGSNQKRMFVTDAAKGFGFIDLSRKRFDVVLMNPPFGAYSVQAVKYLSENYKNCRGDLYPCFIQRYSSSSDFLGAITNRSGFSLKGLEAWRRSNFIDNSSVSLLVDMGGGVLDALVETAAYIVVGKTNRSSLAIDLLAVTSCNRENNLLKTVREVNGGEAVNTYLFYPEYFSELPASPMAYKITPSLLAAFARYPRMECEGFIFRTTSPNYDDFRFMRLRWEVDREDIGIDREWSPIAKGGGYQKYFGDISMVINWDNKRGTFKGFVGSEHRPLERPACADLFFKPGLTWSGRTLSRLSPRVHPAGVIFSSKGPYAGSDDLDENLLNLGILMSAPLQAFLELFVQSGDATSSGSAARDYQVGALRNLPRPSLSSSDADLIVSLVKEAIGIEKRRMFLDETSSYFNPLTIFVAERCTRDFLIEYLAGNECDSFYRELEITKKIDDIVFSGYGLDKNAKSYIENQFGKHPLEYDREYSKEDLNGLMGISTSDIIGRAMAGGKTGRHISVNSYYANRHIEIISHFMEVSPMAFRKEVRDYFKNEFQHSALFTVFASYIFGVIFLRWPIKKNMYNAVLEDAPFNLDSISTVPRERRAGLQIYEIFDGESEELDGKLKDCIDNIFGNSSGTFEECLLAGLGVDRLSKYFSKNTHFFSDHLKKYSRNRRQSPVYWPLQSSSGRYTLWIYFYDVDNQSLYTCVNDFVEPRLARISGSVSLLMGNTSRSQVDDDEMSRLSDLEIELRDFRDGLLRLASYWKPVKSDGVTISAAPLWALFQYPPWRAKLKSTWDTLEQGDYEWSGMAYNIWPERVLKKCYQDRSIAIAHDVEADLWEEVEVPTTRGTGTKLVWQPKELTDSELDAYIQQKIAKG